MAGLALILGIDRVTSTARALTKLIGNGAATRVVAKWTGGLDMAWAQQVPDHSPAHGAMPAEAGESRSMSPAAAGPPV